MKTITSAFAVFLLSAGAILGVGTAASATVIECIPSDGVAAYDEVISEAYDEVVVDAEAHWQRYSAKGSWKEDYAPEFPSDYWVSNVAGDPHGIDAPGPYFVSNENSGNVDWFYLEWVPAETHLVHHDTVIIHHDAVPPVTCDPDEVVPTNPVVKDKCQTADDHYGLPSNTENVTYSRGADRSIIATIVGDFVWGDLPDGYEDQGDGTALFAFDPYLFTNLPCDTPFPAQFNAAVTPPSCIAEGTLTGIDGVFPNVTITVDPEYTGPGQYTVTVTPNADFTLTDIPEGWTPNGDGSVSKVFDVEGVIPVQHENAEAPCFQLITPAPEAPVFTDECGTLTDTTDIPADTEFYTYDSVSSEDGKTISVIAELVNPADTFPADAITEWNYTFTDVACPVELTGDIPKLGAPDPTVPIWLSLVGLLSGAGLLLYGRFRKVAVV